MTVAKTAEKKTLKEYRGELKSAEELMGLTDVPLQVVNVKPPTEGNFWGKPALDTNVVIFMSKIRVDNFDKKALVLSYLDCKHFYTREAYVSRDSQFRVLTGTRAKQLLEDFENHKMKNVRNYCIAPLSRYVGSDPEIFVEDESGNIIPAFNFLGSKEKPNKTARDTSYGGKSMYWDGFQAEFETSAQTCLAWQCDSIHDGLKGVLRAARKVNPKARLSTKTLIQLTPEELENNKPEHIEFGCRPSLNIYGLKGDCDKGGRVVPFRSAGGHIHLGIGKQTETQVEDIVRALDAIVGVACVPLFQSFDHPIRRRYYGLAGEYRLPPHGIEYRVLSNAWIFHPVITNLVFDITRNVANFGRNKLLKLWKSNDDETISTIMNCDVNKAREIMDRNKDLAIKIFNSPYVTMDKNEDTIFNIFYNGMESVIKDPTDIAGNWDLDRNWTTHCDGPNRNWRLSCETIRKGGKV